MNTIKLFNFHLLTKGLQTKEELNIVHANLKEYLEFIKDLRRSISEKEAQVAISQDTAQSNPELQAEVCHVFISFTLSVSFLLGRKIDAQLQFIHHIRI